MNKISIVTVVYNDVPHIESTILSVINQTYPDKEYLIVDGDSTDGTLEILNKYKGNIDILISEPDHGIYDAMNKGIRHAHGEWLIFMNSGDCFVNNETLANVFSEIDQDVDFVYSDFYEKRPTWTKKYTASFERGILLHQSVIYRKNIHDRCGYYLVTKPYMVSDYVFFMMQNPDKVKKVNTIISINDFAGTSNAKWVWYQKICCDFIFRRISVGQLIWQLVERCVKNFIKDCLRMK